MVVSSNGDHGAAILITDGMQLLLSRAVLACNKEPVRSPQFKMVRSLDRFIFRKCLIKWSRNLFMGTYGSPLATSIMKKI